MSNQNNQEYDILYKVVLIGDSGVGKSNISSRFARNEFTVESKATIGVDFCTRTLQVEDKSIKLQIWDTAGQERYRAITSAYYRGSVGVILVYDISKKITFENVDRWYSEVTQNLDIQKCSVILIGNKLDYKHLREVSTNEAIEYCKNKNIKFIEVSALDGKNIETAFTILTTDMYNMHKQPIIDDNDEDSYVNDDTTPIDLDITKKVKPICNC